MSEVEAKDEFLEPSMDEPDIDSIDFEPKPPELNTRNAITAIGSSVVGNIKGKFTNPGKVYGLVKSLLPKELKSAVDEVESVKGNLSSNYNKAKGVIKPVLSQAAKALDGFVPDSFEGTKKFLKKLMVENNKSSYQEPSEDEKIATVLDEIFKAQTAQAELHREEERSEKLVEGEVQKERHAETTGLLTNINLNIQRLTDYNSQINAAYQRKSLEIQLKSYNIAASQLETLKSFTEASIYELKAITKNTALPDYVKIQTSEFFAQQMKGKVFGNVSNWITSKLGSFSLLGNAIKKTVDNKTNELKDFVSNIGDAIGMLADSDLGSMAKDMGEDPALMALKTMVGPQLSDWLIKKALTPLAKSLHDKDGKLRNSWLGKKLRMWNASVNNFGDDLFTDIKDIASYDGYDYDDDKDGFFKKLLKKIPGLPGILSEVVDNYRSEATRVDSSFRLDKGLTLEQREQPTPFDKSVKQSIVEVIPGYLSRILFQVTRFNGGEVEPVEYDLSKGKFITKKEWISQFNKEYNENLDSRVSSIDDGFSDFMKVVLAGKDAYFKPGDSSSYGIYNVGTNLKDDEGNSVKLEDLDIVKKFTDEKNKDITDALKEAFIRASTSISLNLGSNGYTKQLEYIIDDVFKNKKLEDNQQANEFKDKIINSLKVYESNNKDKEETDTTVSEADKEKKALDLADAKIKYDALFKNMNSNIHSHLNAVKQMVENAAWNNNFTTELTRTGLLDKNKVETNGYNSLNLNSVIDDLIHSKKKTSEEISEERSKEWDEYNKYSNLNKADKIASSENKIKQDNPDKYLGEHDNNQTSINRQTPYPQITNVVNKISGKRKGKKSKNLNNASITLPNSVSFNGGDDLLDVNRQQLGKLTSIDDWLHSFNITAMLQAAFPGLADGLNKLSSAVADGFAKVSNFGGTIVFNAKELENAIVNAINRFIPDFKAILNELSLNIKGVTESIKETVKELGTWFLDKSGELINWAWDKGGKAVNWAWDKGGDAINWAWDKGGEAVDWAMEKGKKFKQWWKENGIWEDIKTTVSDVTDWTTDKITKAKNWVVDTVDDALGYPVDVYRKDNLQTPILRAQMMRMGMYRDQKTGEIVKTLNRIKGPLVMTGKTGADEVVLTQEDIEAGLVDANGNDISSLLSRITGGISRAYNKGKEWLGNLLDSVGITGMYNRAKEWLGNIMKGFIININTTFYAERQYLTLIQIRNLLNKHLPVVTGLEPDEYNDSAESIAQGLKDIGGQAPSNSFNEAVKATTEKAKDAIDKSADRLRKMFGLGGKDDDKDDDNNTPSGSGGGGGSPPPSSPSGGSGGSSSGGFFSGLFDYFKNRGNKNNTNNQSTTTNNNNNQQQSTTNNNQQPQSSTTNNQQQNNTTNNQQQSTESKPGFFSNIKQRFINFFSSSNKINTPPTDNKSEGIKTTHQDSFTMDDLTSHAENIKNRSKNKNKKNKKDKVDPRKERRAKRKAAKAAKKAQEEQTASQNISNTENAQQSNSFLDNLKNLFLNPGSGSPIQGLTDKDIEWFTGVNPGREQRIKNKQDSDTPIDTLIDFIRDARDRGFRGEKPVREGNDHRDPTFEFVKGKGFKAAVANGLIDRANETIDLGKDYAQVGKNLWHNIFGWGKGNEGAVARFFGKGRTEKDGSRIMNFFRGYNKLLTEPFLMPFKLLNEFSEKKREDRSLLAKTLGTAGGMMKDLAMFNPLGLTYKGIKSLFYNSENDEHSSKKVPFFRKVANSLFGVKEEGKDANNEQTEQPEDKKESKFSRFKNWFVDQYNKGVEWGKSNRDSSADVKESKFSRFKNWFKDKYTTKDKDGNIQTVPISDIVKEDFTKAKDWVKNKAKGAKDFMVNLVDNISKAHGGKGFSPASFVDGVFENPNIPFKEKLKIIKEEGSKLFKDTKVGNIASKIKDKFSTFKDKLKDTDFAKSIANKYDQAKTKVKDIINNKRFDGIKGKIASGKEWIKDKYNKLGEKITEYKTNIPEKINKNYDKIKGWLNSKYISTKDKFNVFKEWITRDDTSIKEKFNMFKGWMANRGIDIKNKFSSAKEWVKGQLPKLEDKLLDKYISAKERINHFKDWLTNEATGTIKDKFNMFKDWLSSKGKDAKDKFAMFRDWMADKGIELKGKLNSFTDRAKSEISSLKDKGITWAKDKYTSLKDKASNLYNKGKEKFNELKDKGLEKANELKDKGLEWAKDKVNKARNIATNLKDKTIDKAREARDYLKEKYTTLKDKSVDWTKDKYNTLKNKVSEYKDKTKDKIISLKDNIIEHIPSVKDKVLDKYNTVKDKVSGLVGKGKDYIIDKTSNLKDKATGYIKDKISNIGNKVKAGITKASNKLWDGEKWVMSKVADASAMVGNTALNAGRHIKDKATGYIKDGLSNISNKLSGLKDKATNWALDKKDQLKELISDKASDLYNKGKLKAKDLKDKSLDWITDKFTFAKNTASLTKDISLEYLNKGKDKLKQIGSLASGITAGILTGMAGKGKELLGNVGNMVNKGWGGFKSLTKNLTDKATNKLSGLSKDIKDKLDEGKDKVKEKVSDVISSGTNKLKQMGSTATSWLGDKFGGIKDSLSEKFGDVKDSLSEKFSDVKDKFNTGKEKVSEYTKGVKGRFGGFKDKMKDIGGKVFEGAKDKIGNMASGAMGAVKGFFGGLGGMAGLSNAGVEATRDNGGNDAEYAQQIDEAKTTEDKTKLRLARKKEENAREQESARARAEAEGEKRRAGWGMAGGLLGKLMGGLADLGKSALGIGGEVLGAVSDLLGFGSMFGGGAAAAGGVDLSKGKKGKLKGKGKGFFGRIKKMLPKMSKIPKIGKGLAVLGTLVGGYALMSGDDEAMAEVVHPEDDDTPKGSSISTPTNNIKDKSENKLEFNDDEPGLGRLGVELGSDIAIGTAAASALTGLGIASGPAGWLALGLATAATYIGGKIWDKLTNDLEEFERLRFAAYGFDTSDKSIISKVRNLEELAIKKYSSNGGIDGRFLKDGRVYQIIGVDPEDTEEVKYVASWAQNRFLPALQVSMNAAQKANNNKDCRLIDTKVDDKSIKAEYLQALDGYKGVNFKYLKNPFDIGFFSVGDLDTDYDDVKEMIEDLKDKYPPDLIKEKKDSSSNKGVTAAAAATALGATANKVDTGLKDLDRDKSGIDKYPVKEYQSDFARRLDTAKNVISSIGKTIFEYSPFGMAYKAGKWVSDLLFDKDPTLVDMVRLTQYGFGSTKNTLEINSTIKAVFKLEQFLEDEIIKISNKVATVDKNKLVSNFKEISDIMGVTMKESSGFDSYKYFLEWFNKRFLPAYMVNVNALLKANGETDLSKLNDLEETNELPTYLVAVEAGNLDIDYSQDKDPVDPTKPLPGTPTEFTTLMDGLKNKYPLKDEGSKKAIINDVKAMRAEVKNQENIANAANGGKVEARPLTFFEKMWGVDNRSKEEKAAADYLSNQNNSNSISSTPGAQQDTGLNSQVSRGGNGQQIGPGPSAGSDKLPPTAELAGDPGLPPQLTKGNKKDFVMRILAGAIQGFKEYNVLPSITLAQGALESGWGKHESGKNNLFGIKADKSWKGSSTQVATHEVYGGKRVGIKDGFRDYDSIDQGVADHARFLAKNPRYAKAGFFSTSYVDAANALQKAGYATDPNYANTLIKMIRSNGFDKWDNKESFKLIKTAGSSIADKIGGAAGLAFKAGQYVGEKAIDAAKSTGTMAFKAGQYVGEKAVEYAPKAYDAAKYVGGKAIDGATMVGKAAFKTGQYVGEKAVEYAPKAYDAAKYVGNKVEEYAPIAYGAAKYVGGKVVDANHYIGNKAMDGAKWAGGKVMQGINTLNNMGIMENVIKSMQVNAKGARYEMNSNRTKPGIYDCSSFQIRNLNENGFHIPVVNTAGMRKELQKAGFTWHEGKIDKGNLSKLQRGDILLRDTTRPGHTEMYLGDGQIIGARNGSKPYPYGVGPRSYFGKYDGFFRLGAGKANTGDNKDVTKPDRPVTEDNDQQQTGMSSPSNQANTGRAQQQALQPTKPISSSLDSVPANNVTTPTPPAPPPGGSLNKGGGEDTKLQIEMLQTQKEISGTLKQILQCISPENMMKYAQAASKNNSNPNDLSSNGAGNSNGYNQKSMMFNKINDKQSLPVPGVSLNKAKYI